MKADFPYRRIGPATSHILGHDSLWLATDHLLLVKNRRFGEEYLRFDLREIQAIVIRKQSRFVIPVYWLVAAIVALIVGIIGSVRGPALLTGAGWGGLLLLSVYWISVSLARSCSCYLQTAIHAYELPGLYRYHAARRVLETLESRIAEVQGVLPEEWTADETAQIAPPEPVAPGRAPILFPVLACFGLLLDALISWLVRRQNAPRILITMGGLVTLVAVVLPIVAIVLTRRDRRFRHVHILFLIAFFAVGFANYGNTTVSSFLATLRQAGQTAPLSLAGAGDFLYWVNQVAEIGIGSIALLLLMAETRRGAIGRQPSVL